MKESADKDLKEHIIKIFDNYDDGGAEQGWLELRKKHPAKPAKQSIMWWSSAAAILVIAGSLLLINARKEDEHEIIAKNRSKEVPKDTTTNNASSISVKKTAGAKRIGTSKSIAPLPLQNLAKTTNNKPIAHTRNKQVNTKSFTASKKEPPTQILAPNIISQEPDSSVTAEKLRIHAGQPLTQNSLTENPVSTNESDSFFSNRKSAVSPEIKTELIEKTEESSSNKKMELSFYAGPFFNYAEGSSNSMNLTAGVTSGILISKRFTLIAGLALAKNTLVFDNQVPANSYMAFLNSAALGQQSPNLLAKSSVDQISKLKAQLLNLDIPVNIKYSLSREIDKVFVTAGLSSFAYLNEAYHYSFNNLSNNSKMNSPSSDEVINKNFGKFDLAQTLNLSIGFTHKAKVQSFVLEPFIKYPLGPLGSQDIRFGSAGINFKLNIRPAGKRITTK